MIASEAQTTAYPPAGQIRGTYQGQGVQYAGAAATPVAPMTLASATSGFEGVNQRLGELLGKAHQIAIAVGGPFPVGANNAKDGPPVDSAVARLNQLSGRAHTQLDDLSECLNAMARSLGA